MSRRHLFSLVRIISARQRSLSLCLCAIRNRVAQSRMSRSLIKAISARTTSAGNFASFSAINEMLQLFRIRFQLIGFACFNLGRYKLRIIAWKARERAFSRGSRLMRAFHSFLLSCGSHRAGNGMHCALAEAPTADRRRAADGAERPRVVSASGVIITGCRGNNFVLSNVLKNNVAAKQTGCSSRSRFALAFEFAHEPIGYE